MKKLLFVHDHIFYKKDNCIYSGGSFPKEVWDRYINYFDTIEVVARGELWAENIPGLIESTHDKVTFNLLNEIKGGKDYFTKSHIIKLKLKEAIQRADTVIIRLPSSIGLYCADLCKKMGKRYFTEVVGCVWDASWNYGNVMGKLTAPYLYYKNKQAIRSSDGSLYVTKHFLQNRYPNPGKLVTHASNVIIDDFPSKILENHLRLIETEKEVLNFGLIGNLEVKYKGFDIAMRALSIFKQKTNHHFVLHLVGGGKDDYIKKLVTLYNLKDNVNIVGRLKSGNEVFEFLDTLDIYIHPSRQEGLPRSVIEAMGRGCPVLASSIAGVPELIENQYLHKPGDYKKLAQQLYLYTQDKAELIRMSETNFKKSKEYTNDILTKRRNQFLEKVSNII